MTWKKTSLSYASSSRETSDEFTTLGGIFMRQIVKVKQMRVGRFSSPRGKASFVCYDLPRCVLNTSRVANGFCVTFDVPKISRVTRG